MNNTITNTKNTLEGNSSRVIEAEEWISELEDKCWKQLKQSRIKKNKCVLKSSPYFFKSFVLFYLFVFAGLGLRCCVSYSLVVVCGLLLLWSPGSRAHRLQWLLLMGSVVVAHGL